MFNIVIVSGGTGSMQIQKGFSNLLGYRNYNLDVVINAYDNGKSTGECRKAFNGQILGASDLRKNQLLQFELFYEKELKKEESYESRLLELFELRFSAGGHKEYYEKSLAYIDGACFLREQQRKQLVSWVEHFFLAEKKPLRFRKEIEGLAYVDFSLSNVFYSASAAMNGNSLARAGMEMSRFLGIPNKVRLISDVNLFLSARTESGHVIKDEGEIVAWDNASDKIVQALLYDRECREYVPAVDENNPDGGRVSEVFRDADIIIMSSGTQWSSLIPTYMHKGFADLISDSRAVKYIVMNNIEDSDMLGVCADDLLEIIKRYIPVSELRVVVNRSAAPSMNSISEEYRQICGAISDEGKKKHDPEKLVRLILEDFFDICKRDCLIISDLDGTLWEERGNEQEKAVGTENLRIFDGIIFSGNTYEHVYAIVSKYFKNENGHPVYSDYGNTKILGRQTSIVDESFLIDDELVDELDGYSEFSGKVGMRGGCVVTIKPLEGREEKISLLEDVLRKYMGKYVCNIAGRTSIDIMKAGFDKAATLRAVINQENIDINKILYVGNELDEGNEACLKKFGLRTLQVDDVFEMNSFLRVYFGRRGR